MIARSVTAAVLFAWVADDEVYEDNGPLRTWLEAERIAYVLPVACDHRVPAVAGHAPRAGQLAARLPGGPGSGCPQGPTPKDADGTTGHGHHQRFRPGYRYLLIRRNRSTGELAFYRCFTRTRRPAGVRHGLGPGARDGGDQPRDVRRQARRAHSVGACALSRTRSRTAA